MADTTAMPMCPMAKMCKGIAEKPRSGFLVFLPGALLIVLGLAIILQPKILVWLIAIALIVMGVGLLMMGNFMRKSDSWMQGMHG